MLIRFIAGALHPLIHAGYAVEFDIPGILAEGAIANVKSSQRAEAFSRSGPGVRPS
jgi:hypothetical protein